MRLEPDFREALARFDLDELDRSRHTVVGLRLDFTIGFRNQGWYRFAAENGGSAEMADDWAPPRTLLDGIAPPVQGFYRRLFLRALEKGEPVDHFYLCPSPRLHRQHRLRVQPLDPGLLLVHQLVVEAPHHRPSCGPDLGPYKGPHGILTVCCHCRATRRADAPDTWDWVPDVIAQPRDDVSHGLCPLCFRHHYPELIESWDGRGHRSA